jgi:DNA-directed RNA polymerase specialized sigma24 family protein
MTSKVPTAKDGNATDADVEAAIAALSTADLLRLQSIADRRARALMRFGLGWTGADLLQEALTRAVAGQKRWPKSVKFVTYLIQSMRNIAGHSRDAAGEELTGLGAPGEGEHVRDGAIAASSVHDIERQAAAHECLRKINDIFGDDVEVQLVLDGLAETMSGPQIQQALNITPTDYNTIMKRLRRGIARDKGWRP